jgi:hypothetical protein
MFQVITLHFLVLHPLHLIWCIFHHELGACCRVRQFQGSGVFPPWFPLILNCLLTVVNEIQLLMLESRLVGKIDRNASIDRRQA